MTATWSGVPEMMRKVNRLGPAGVRALQLALKDEAEAVKAASLLIVPTDEGILRNSCYVDDVATVTPGGGVEIRITYGNNAAPYALIQHEEPDFRHDPPETYKYLERPLKAAIATMLPRIAAFVNLCYAMSGKADVRPTTGPSRRRPT